jgi:hypothetical protein
MLSPAQLARSLQRFSADNIITLDEELVLLSDFGRRWVLANRLSIFFGISEKSWKEPLGSNKVSKEEGTQNYFPNLDKLHRRFLTD